MTIAPVKGFVVITGGASGIGKETGFAFAESGANGVLFADIDEKNGILTAEESKKYATHTDYKAIALKVDVTDAHSVQNMVDVIVKEFGRIDHCINSAGLETAELAPFIDTLEDDFDRLWSVNTKGAFLVSKAVANLMVSQDPVTLTTKRQGTRTVGRGSIVNVASMMSVGAVPFKTPYISAKHGLLGLTRAAAMDLNKAGVRVNIVSPTWVETPLLDGERDKIPRLDDLIKKLIPAGRPAGSDEIAAAILYLSSPSSAYITGTNITIDAGISLGPSLG